MITSTESPTPTLGPLCKYIIHLISGLSVLTYVQHASRSLYSRPRSIHNKHNRMESPSRVIGSMASIAADFELIQRYNNILLVFVPTQKQSRSKRTCEGEHNSTRRQTHAISVITHTMYTSCHKEPSGDDASRSVTCLVVDHALHNILVRLDSVGSMRVDRHALPFDLVYTHSNGNSFQLVVLNITTFLLGSSQ